MNKYNERCGVDEVRRTKKPRKVVRNKDVGTAQATLHLLATGLASRTGCIHLVARDGTAATFDPFEGGRAEYAAMLLRGVRREHFGGLLLTGRCSKKDIIAYLDSRDEAEIVIDPEHVEVNGIESVELLTESVGSGKVRER